MHKNHAIFVKLIYRKSNKTLFTYSFNSIAILMKIGFRVIFCNNPRVYFNLARGITVEFRRGLTK